MQKSTTQNIKNTLKLFGIDNWDAPYYVSGGVGINYYPHEPFRADYFIYGICIAGNATIALNNTPVPLKAGTFFAAIPSTIVQVTAHKPSFKAKLLVFEKSFLLKNILDARQLQQLGFFTYDSVNFIHLDKEEFKLLTGLCDRVNDRKEFDGIFKNQIVQSLIFNLLFETAEIFLFHRNEVAIKAIKRDDELFFKFYRLVHFNCHTEKRLAYYAGKLFISEKYLIKICNDVAGKTPGAIINEAVLSEAKLLLKNPDNNIAMVSQMLNFSSLASFSRFFKQHSGVSPSEYKNN